MIGEVIKIIRKGKTTLIFTNTRSQCEIWYHTIIHSYPELAGEIAMHHGSIDKKIRLILEDTWNKVLVTKDTYIEYVNKFQ